MEVSRRMLGGALGDAMTAVIVALEMLVAAKLGVAVTPLATRLAAVALAVSRLALISVEAVKEQQW